MVSDNVLRDGEPATYVRDLHVAETEARAAQEQYHTMVDFVHAVANEEGEKKSEPQISWREAEIMAAVRAQDITDKFIASFDEVGGTENVSPKQLEDLRIFLDMLESKGIMRQLVGSENMQSLYMKFAEIFEDTDISAISTDQKWSDEKFQSYFEEKFKKLEGDAQFGQIAKDNKSAFKHFVELVMKERMFASLEVLVSG